ncbi:hypothetical protein M885DRAFT_611675 [Pelagophyceae sp. CCMP2097]|nr:hypothetical protein M885DRAFT_611675 [Pelagophyceae sp. CCMP2097]
MLRGVCVLGRPALRPAPHLASWLRLAPRALAARCAASGSKRVYKPGAQRPIAPKQPRPRKMWDTIDDDDDDEDDGDHVARHWMVDQARSLGGRVAVLGDGDLSFSNALSQRLVEAGSEASALVASTLAAEVDVFRDYGEKSRTAVSELRKRGADVRFGLDATAHAAALARHDHVTTFIWNFPSESVKTTGRKEENRDMLYKLLENLSRAGGPFAVWITLFGNQFKQWELDPRRWAEPHREFGQSGTVRLVEEKAFDHEGAFVNYTRNFKAGRRKMTTYLFKVTAAK